MKVLLIMPLSYGYYNSIIDVLLKRGDQVCFIPDFDENIIKRFIRKFFSISSLQNYYIRRKIGKLKDDFDVIVLIRGYCFSLATILWLNNKFKNSKFVLYQWDPLSVSLFDAKSLKFFDKLFSFDKSDCMKFGMNYLPLFYKSLPDIYCKNIHERDERVDEKFFDFSFVGSGHSQRLFVLGKLIILLKTQGYNYFIRVYINRFIFYLGCVFNRLGYRAFPRECLSFKPVPKCVSDDIMMRSRVIIDVHHPLQTGLSIRVMEVLGAGKSVVTTNKSILDEPFFDSDIIGIIEENKIPSNIHILLENKKAADVSLYEINNWINILLPTF